MHKSKKKKKLPSGSHISMDSAANLHNKVAYRNNVKALGQFPTSLRCKTKGKCLD